MHEVQPMNNTTTILLKHLNQSNFQMLQHQQQVQIQPPPSLKCPRCDSVNTKFCYYNNYNLSQPRHFCKNCRRYWTKGGVLRNVPVGGGCRKSKRSSSSTSTNKNHKSSSYSSKSFTETVTNSSNGLNSNSHSSSESSTALFQVVPEVEILDNMREGLFSGSEFEGFMNLLPENNNNNKNISNNNISNEIGDVCTTSFSEYLESQGMQDWDMGKICGGVHGVDKMVGAVDLVNPTDRIEDLLQSRGSNVGIITLDWHLTAGNENSNNFDDSSTVDPHHGYWGQSTVDDHHDHADHDSQWFGSTTTHLPLFLP